MSPYEDARDRLFRPIRFQQNTLEDFSSSLARERRMVDMYRQNSQICAGTAPRTPESSSSTTFRQWCATVLKPAVES